MQQKTMISYIITGCLALAGTFSLPYAMRLGNDTRMLSNSILSVFLFVAIFILYHHVSSIRNRRLMICSGILGMIFSTILIIASNVYLYDTAAISFFAILCILSLAPLMTAVVAILFTKGQEVIQLLNVSFLEQKLNSICKNRKKLFVGCWLFVFVSWIPGLLATYPCVYMVDSVFQSKWFFTGEVYAHHPVAHTYLLGFFLKFGKEIFHSYETGMLLYSLCQMLFLSGIFAYISVKLMKRLPMVVSVLILLLYALLPYNVVFSFTATKDVIFAGFFLLLVYKTAEIIWEKQQFFQSWKKQAAYIATWLLACAFRNTGYYMFLCMIPVFFIICRKYWKNILILCMIIIGVWSIYTGPFFDALQIHKGSPAEMLSVPLQQMARVMNQYGDQLPEETRNEVETYIPDYASYTPKVSDNVKDTFNKEKFEEAPSNFIKLWVEIGLEYPVCYVDAFLSLNLGFWYPDMVYPDPGAYLPHIQYENASIAERDEFSMEGIYIERHSLLPSLEKVYAAWTEGAEYQKIPVVSMLFSPGAAFWLLLLCVMYIIWQKKYELLLPAALLILLWLTLMVSPVVLLRYAYPLMISVPVMLGICAKEKGNS